jgi:ribosomal protein S18 acetylase RimI-like enzyme
MQTQMIDELALRAQRTRNASGPVVRPRIGLLRPWSASMDEGWTRWLFEEYGFAFSNVRNADIRAGGLQERFDVIVLAADRSGTIVNGFAKGSVPPRYAGGIGAAGVRALDDFVRHGGTLVCLNQSTAFAIEELHLPVKNVVEELGRGDFFVSGSILEVTTDPAHPVMAGMPERAKIFADRSPVFTTTEGFEGAALAKYQEAGSPLLSGYLLGEAHLQGYAAALDVHHGEGHVILIGFRPQWRGQPFGTFRVLFNAALYGGAMAAGTHGSPGFWSAPPEKEETTEDSQNR